MIGGTRSGSGRRRSGRCPLRRRWLSRVSREWLVVGLECLVTSSQYLVMSGCRLGFRLGAVVAPAESRFLTWFGMTRGSVGIDKEFVRNDKVLKRTRRLT
jgi:hypothetical protein